MKVYVLYQMVTLGDHLPPNDPNFYILCVTNTSTTYTTRPSYSLLHYLLPFPSSCRLDFIHIYSHASILHNDVVTMEG